MWRARFGRDFGPVVRQTTTEWMILTLGRLIYVDGKNPYIQSCRETDEHFHTQCHSAGGPGSAVGIATGYGLDGPGIESPWGEIFCTCPDRPWGPTSLLYSGQRVFPGGKKRPGRDADLSPPSSAVSHERVELYLYSPSWPYGLHRAAVPVQGCTLPLPYYYEACPSNFIIVRSVGILQNN
jgi:hypothetical protein